MSSTNSDPPVVLICLDIVEYYGTRFEFVRNDLFV